MMPQTWKFAEVPPTQSLAPEGIKLQRIGLKGRTQDEILSKFHCIPRITLTKGIYTI